MNRAEWIAKCQQWREDWPIMQPEYQANNSTGKLNLYAVLDAINKHSTADSILMGDAGSISYAGPVALNAKPGQRFIFSPAQADMGWALPAAIGVAMASQQPVISIIGDGSFMSNLQELAVVKQHELNIKFVILNNNGYLSIKNTQSKYYQGRVYGTSSETGLWFPDFFYVASSFQIAYRPVMFQRDLDNFHKLLNMPGPMILDCACLEDQEILPSQALKNGKQAPLHDMIPFLDPDVLAKESFIQDQQ